MNQAFKTHVRERLQDEVYLYETGYTLEYVVDRACLFFENYDKRKKDATGMPRGSIEIPHLRADAKKRFQNNVMMMDK